MLHPSYTDLINVVNKDIEPGEQPVVQSRYSIVIATAKRARQIIAGDEPMIAKAYNKKPLSIAVEELAQLGIRTFLRIGTTGAIQPHINVGDVLVTTASVRLDGASLHFAPLEFPAVADFECTTALVEAAKSIGATTHVGVTASSDTFYPGQERYDTYSGRVVRHFKGSMEEWQAMGVMNYEMESATLLTMCASQGLRAGMVAGVIVNRTQQEIPNAETMKQTESHAVKIVVEAARRLLK